MTNYEKVVEFHKLFSALINTSYTIPDKMVCNLRYNLIKEESGELLNAVIDKNIDKIADGISDTLYVVYGTGASFGISLNSSPVIGNSPIDVYNELEKLTVFLEGFKDSIVDSDFTMIRNFLRGIIRICYTIGKAYSIDVDKAFDIVHESNMSKAHNTEEEARATQNFHLNDGVTSNIRRSNDKFVVYRNSDDKVLKSIYYTPADFTIMNLTPIS